MNDLSPRASRISLVGALALAALLAACSRTQSSATDPPPVTPTPPSEAPPVAPPPVAPPPAVPAVASGPSASLTGEHYTVSAAIDAPPAVPGASSLSIEVRATDGFHVNDLYPVSLVNVRATGATAPATVPRSQATEVSQARAAFRVPVQVAAAGASVSGTVRFAVCSDTNCVPHTQDFAVALR